MTPVRCFVLEPTGRESSEDGCTTPIYQRADTGEEMTWQAAPAGAMMYADQWQCSFTGPDGRVLVVKVPANADGTGRSRLGPSMTQSARPVLGSGPVRRRRSR